MARASDRRVLSRDNEVRRCFAGVCSDAALTLGDIHWCNPGEPAEEVCSWLHRGAPAEPHRTLAFYRRR